LRAWDQLSNDERKILTDAATEPRKVSRETDKELYSEIEKVRGRP
jgi:TRAP-type C4-dicarboxylate transport system substrate-binding protein